MWSRPAPCVWSNGTELPPHTRVRNSVRGYVFVSRWSCTVTCSSRERERSARAICSSGLQLNLSATGVTCWLLARARAQRGARAGCSRERERERDAFTAYGSIHRVSARSPEPRAHANTPPGSLSAEGRCADRWTKSWQLSPHTLSLQSSSTSLSLSLSSLSRFSLSLLSLSPLFPRACTRGDEARVAPETREDMVDSTS